MQKKQEEKILFKEVIGSNYKSKSVMNYTTKLISKQQNKTHIFIYMIIYKLKLLLKLILYFTFPNFIFYLPVLSASPASPDPLL